MVKIYKQPFAHEGDTIEIPDASQPDGKMSSADGWTPDYQLLKTDPNYKPVGRQEMNGVFKEVTEALGEIQQFGFAKWQPITWPQGARVVEGGAVYRALTQTSQQPPHADWVDEAAVRLAGNQTIAGIKTFSSFPVTPSAAPTANYQAANKKYVDDSVIGVGQMWQNVDRVAGTTYTNNTGKPISVSISIESTVANQRFHFLVDGVRVGYAGSSGSISNGGVQQVFAIVAAGSTYSFTSDVTTLFSWLELR